MTSLEKHTGRPLVAPWLRGWVDDEPQTTVIWRRYLPVRVGGDVSHAEIKDFFEAAPPHLSETLETETIRHVVPWLIKRALAVVKEAEKNEPSAIAPSASSDEDEPQRIERGSVVAIVLGRSLEVIDVLKLSDLLFDSDDKKENAKCKGELERKLYGNTLVLEYRLAGLSQGGLLDATASSAPAVADGDDEWVNDDESESTSPPTPAFRIRESVEDSASDDPNWWCCFRFASSVTDEGDPKRYLLIDKWKHSGNSEDGRSAGREQRLDEHQEWAAREAKYIADRLGLPSDYARMLGVVARLHDEGKRVDRWQRAFSAPVNGTAYAKTRGPIKFSLLDGYRHEFGSLPALELDDEFVALDDDLRELARHLVVAHHGFGRPIVRVDGCDDAPPSSLESRAREVALRFVRLQRRWGPWGLAWWESLLRSADQRASRANDDADKQSAKPVTEKPTEHSGGSEVRNG